MKIMARESAVAPRVRPATINELPVGHLCTPYATTSGDSVTRHENRVLNAASRDVTRLICDNVPFGHGCPIPKDSEYVSRRSYLA